MKHMLLVLAILFSGISGLAGQGMMPLGAGQAAQPPLMKIAEITFKNTDEFLGNVQVIVDKVMPGMGEAQVQMQLLQQLGIPGLPGIAKDKPVHIVVGLNMMKAVVALYMPVTGEEAFREGLVPGTLLGGAPGMSWPTAMTGEAMMIAMGPGAMGLAEEALETVKGWQPEGDSDGHLGLITATLPEPLRQKGSALLQQAQGFIMMMMMGGGGGPQGGPLGGLDPQTAIEAIRMAKTLVDGIDKLIISIDMDAKDLKLNIRLVPLEESQLLKDLAPSEDVIKTVSGLLAVKSQIRVAGLMNAGSALADVEKKLAPSLKLQGFDPETVQLLTTQLKGLSEIMIPCQYFAGVDVTEKGFAIRAVYQLDEGKGAQVFDQYQSFCDATSEVLTGEGKPYSSFDYVPESRLAGELRVDRISFGVNPDHPQVAQLRQAMGGKDLADVGLDKIDLEMTILGDLVVIATAGELDAFLETVKLKIPVPAKLRDKTVIAGSCNVLALIKYVMPLFGLTPPDAVEILKELDPAGVEIELDMVVNNEFEMGLSMPLLLIQKIQEVTSKVQGAMAAPMPPVDMEPF